MATGQSGGEPEASPDHNFSSDYPMQLPPKHEDHIADILPDAVNHAIASEDHLQHVGQAADQQPMVLDVARRLPDAGSWTDKHLVLTFVDNGRKRMMVA